MDTRASELSDVILTTSSDRYASHDESWRRQVAELHRSLQLGGVDIRREERSVDGKKAGIEVVILALGSAGVVKAANDAFRAWLGRDRSRHVRLVVMQEGRESSLELSADLMSDETVRHILSLTATSKPDA
jgi:hypothetical protein